MKGTVDERIALIMQGKEEVFRNLFVTSDMIIGEIAKQYMSVASLDDFDIPIIQHKVNEDVATVLTENKINTVELNNDYYYMVDALREILMWIMEKYNMSFYTKDNEEYCLQLDNGDTYIINLNQVYNMIDKEHDFFKNFECNTHITNTKNKIDSNNIEGFYFSVEEQNSKEIDRKISEEKLDDLVVSNFMSLVKSSYNKSLLLLNLTVEYKIKTKESIFVKKEFKSVLITPDNGVYSEENIIRLFYIMPTAPLVTTRIETVNDFSKYVFVYNEMLKDYLIEDKVKDTKEFDISIEDVKFSIYNGTIIKIV